MRPLAALSVLLLMQPVPAATAAPQNNGQLARLGWQNLTLVFPFPQNHTSVVVRFERNLDMAAGAQLQDIVVSVGAQSYVVHDRGLALIKLDEAGDCWTSLYMAADNSKYVSLYIPEPGGMLAEIDILGMKSHRINIRSL